MTTLPTSSPLSLRLTSLEHQRLGLLVTAALEARPRNPETLLSLQKELARAEIVAPELLPADVVTMGSSVELVDLESGEIERYTLVFPDQADAEHGRLSILAPIGTAILGFKQGDHFAWQTPGGTRRLEIRSVTTARQT